jgi:hypothetical protein
MAAESGQVTTGRSQGVSVQLWVALMPLSSSWHGPYLHTMNRVRVSFDGPKEERGVPLGTPRLTPSRYILVTCPGWEP